MFTQVLGIMTSLVIMSHSKEWPFALLQSQAILFSQSTASALDHVPCTELSPSENISHGRYDSSRIIIWQFIQVPEDILALSESDKHKSVRERKTACPKQSYNESQTSSEESDDSNDT
jgi:hypothetical protein